MAVSSIEFQLKRRWFYKPLFLMLWCLVAIGLNPAKASMFLARSAITLRLK